ncbi:MAG: Uncharacterised protein [Acidimicrobiaceae bacterium]|nr:MAG: Uncharacterised protein [Acidimicrobiaceae bacterium]
MTLMQRAITLENKSARNNSTWIKSSSDDLSSGSYISTPPKDFFIDNPVSDSLRANKLIWSFTSTAAKAESFPRYMVNAVFIYICDLHFFNIL